ncbi:hypothetical protein PC117_g19967 [Phytophthora cactorum]|uniref:P-loop containing nucleoside triphosphate hydrolase n=1 Tax=Phytophthora cactorum TaxID=29920 RepID=A0A8T1BQH8_9STRA|nr:hypothetical protein PC117_g19967 [Phytophthora cactorum]
MYADLENILKKEASPGTVSGLACLGSGSLCSNPQHKQQTSDSNLLYRLYDFIMVKYATDNVTSTPTQDNSDVDKVENGYANMPNTPKATDVMPILAEKPRTILPTQNPFSRDVYYVRECFPRYYALIIDLLLHHNTDIATITGTSGIGTSAFYGYFFTRYSREHPHVTIVTAAFSDEDQLQGSTVFQEGQYRKHYAGDYYKLVHAKRQDAAERGVEALYLFDGPPPFPPPHREKMVPESDVVQRDLQTS